MEEATATKKRKINRSPKHPALDLESAIERLGLFYKSAWDHAVGVEAACDIWGLTYGGGTANRELSALVQFGLLETEGRGDERKVKITDRGKDIVTDPDGVTTGRAEAIKAAALAPAIYKKVWSRWGPRLPADDRTMAPALIRDFGFNPNATDDFLRDFRSTLKFAGLDKLAPEGEVDEASNGGPEVRHEAGRDSPRGGGGEPEEPDPPENRKREARAPMSASEDDAPAQDEVRVADYTIPLRGGGTAVLSIPVPLSSRNYKALEGWLKWAKESLVGEEADEGGDRGS